TRDPNGPVGVVGVTRISGEVAAADAVPTSWKIAQFLGMVASLNLFLCLFNLIPLLPLDGGHAAGAIWEGIRRRIAKWRHRPDPGYVDVARALPVAYAVAFLLIGMSGLLLYADVVNPIHIGG
ncbi:MAG: site-2 protease family protein, partial [Actinomycetes bacterium]